MYLEIIILFLLFGSEVIVISEDEGINHCYESYSDSEEIKEEKPQKPHNPYDIDPADIDINSFL